MRPVGGTERTSLWGPVDGESSAAPEGYQGPGTVRDNVGLLVPEGTPAGEYELLMGLYDAATGQRLSARVRGGRGRVLDDALVVGTVVVRD
jgi:hypothetical protein